MAFFEQLGRRITNAGQDVAQQTRVLTDVARLNMKISENKKAMSQLLFELGQDYYQKHRKETDNEEQQYIDRVNELFLQITQWQDEIEQAKSSGTCRVCGARVTAGSAFCMNCGAKLNGAGPEDTMSLPDLTRKCPVCGAAAEEDGAFCIVCGAKLEEAVPAPEDVSLPDWTRKCPVCGAAAEADNAFCSVCGAKLEEVCPEVRCDALEFTADDILTPCVSRACPVCGREAADGDSFCMNCGTKLPE